MKKYSLSIIGAMVFIAILAINYYLTNPTNPTSQQANIEPINIAVSSNFANTIKPIATEFSKATGNKVNLIFGATGKHYLQIKNGAPFDIFFAADAKHPKLLVQDGLALANSRFTYAVGKIVLWSPKNQNIDLEEKLKTGDFNYLAIANPKFAPYGKAAKQTLDNLNLMNLLQNKIVLGENINQALHFVSSGNAELGFVAHAQITNLSSKPDFKGSFWQVPQHLYNRIEQQAVLLTDNAVARQFIQFTKSATALKIIKNLGYEIP